MINSISNVTKVPTMPLLMNDTRNDNVLKAFDVFKNSAIYTTPIALNADKIILFDRVNDNMNFLNSNKKYVTNYDSDDHKDQKKLVRLLFATFMFTGTFPTSEYLYSIFFGEF